MTSSAHLKVGLAFALWVSFFAPALSHGQASSTPVIGYYSFQAPAGVSLWTCALTTRKEFQGISTGVTAATTSTVSQSAAAWVPGAFSLHFLEVVEGPWAGLVLDIISNTGTTVTVQGNLGPAGFNLGPNFRYTIRKHATLGTIFQGGAGLNQFDDSVVLLYADGSRRKFFYNGTAPGSIVADDFFTNRNAEIVYPGQGMLLNCSGPRTITFGGGEVCYVKDTPTKIPLYAGKVNFVGGMNPVVASDPLTTVTAVEASALASPALGLTDSNLSQYDDLISVYGRTGGLFTRQGTFFYDRARDTIVTTLGQTTAASLPHGTAFTIKPSGDRYLTQPAAVSGH